MERQIERKVPPNRLRELRERSGLSQKEVADLIGGVSTAVVSRHETGKLRLSHDAVIRYSHTYRVWSHELFYDPEDPVSSHKNRLRELRARSRLTEREVAKILDITPEAVLAFESGERPLSQNAIERFSRLYKVWTYELFENPVRPEDAWDGDRARFLVEQQLPPDVVKRLGDVINPPDATMGPKIESE
jgi:transcriptional regulator with XRE-family HTH domain